MKYVIPIVIVFLVVFAVIRSGGEKDQGDSEKMKFAFVTNGPAKFWEYARAGCYEASKELGVDVDFRLPDTGPKQTKLLEDLLLLDVKGIAISPIDPTNQTSHFNKVAKKTILITHDSDAPKSDRQFYIGTNNYEAGRQAGKLVKECLPNGGKVMLFVGKISALNATERRQGVVDELLGVEFGKGPTFTAKGDADCGKWKIIGTMTDEGDAIVAEKNAKNALNLHPDIKCMVGLWGYNIPSCLKAMSDEQKKAIKLVSFDEYAETLNGIKEGTVYATVAQRPFAFGKLCIKYMKEIAEGKKPDIPENKLKYIPTDVISGKNIDTFLAQYAQYDKILDEMSSGKNAKK